MIDDPLELATASDGLLLAEILGDEAVRPVEKPIGVASRSCRRTAAGRSYQNLLKVKARMRIAIAARWDRADQLGTALVRLNDIYRRALAVQDAKTALAVQKELNRLLDLYRPLAASPAKAVGDRPSPDAAASAEAEIATARAHLEPLGLGDERTSLAELCRLAVLRIIEDGRECSISPTSRAHGRGPEGSGQARARHRPHSAD